MNKTVTATGMTLTAKVNSNLLIAPLGAAEYGTTVMPATTAYKNHMVIADAAQLLEPVSSVDGKAFFYTSTANADATGATIDDIYVAYDHANTVADATDAVTFDENYGTTGAKGYKDYVFALQAINTATATQYVDLTGLTLTYSGATDADLAFRTAVLVQEVTDAAGAAALTDVTTKTILGSTGSDYFTTKQAVTSTTALAEVTTYGTAANIGEVAAGATKYFKVTVRIWLEGEDKTCNTTTFATLNGKWALDLKFDFQDEVAHNEASGTNKPIALISRVNTDATNAYSMTIATNTGTVVVGGTTYYGYAATKGTATGSTLYSTDATLTVNSHVYTIVGSAVTDVTNITTITP